ncbi:MAG: hypothetical protein HOO06_05775 [Bdellovibrionaceae bacterium]|jgi:hypothetical protein|nr:hypothetical protein [Pseudobdellovibrionaceae bacterium]
MQQLSVIIFVALFLFQYENVFALDKGSRYQVHTRMGLFSGSYAGSGVETRAWSVPTTIDIEMEIFQSRVKSYTLRAVMAMELDTNRVNYTYAGIGQSNYIASRGRKDFRTEKRVQFKNTPKLRYYWGWNVGVAQVLVIDFGLVLGTYSTVLDMSGNAGAIYQVGENLGIEARAGLGLGYGFSTVTVTGTTTRMLVGLTYFY